MKAFNQLRMAVWFTLFLMLGACTGPKLTPAPQRDAQRMGAPSVPAPHGDAEGVGTMPPCNGGALYDLNPLHICADGSSYQYELIHAAYFDFDFNGTPTPLLLKDHCSGAITVVDPGAAVVRDGIVFYQGYLFEYLNYAWGPNQSSLVSLSPYPGAPANLSSTPYCSFPAVAPASAKKNMEAYCEKTGTGSAVTFITNSSAGLSASLGSQCGAPGTNCMGSTNPARKTVIGSMVQYDSADFQLQIDTSSSSEAYRYSGTLAVKKGYYENLPAGSYASLDCWLSR